MIRGIQIIDADNAMICGHIELIARPYGGPEKLYMIRFHPDVGIAYDEKDDDGEWQEVKRHCSEEEIIALLPKDGGWTWRELILAATFFGEGCKKGHQEEEKHWAKRVDRLKTKIKELEDGTSSD